MKQIIKIVVFVLICIACTITYAVLRNLEVDGRIIINIGMFMLVSILYYNFFQKKKPKGDDKK
jgi:hypothetical protein